MESVIVSDFGVMLGKTSERLVVRGPRPRLELIEGGPQLFLPIELPPRPRLQMMTSGGVKKPEVPLRERRSGNDGSPRTKPDQIELPLFRVSEIIVTGGGVSVSSDLIEECCERGIRLSFLTSSGRPFAMLSSPMLTATVQTRREQFAAYGDGRGLEFAKAIVRGKIWDRANKEPEKWTLEVEDPAGNLAEVRAHRVGILPQPIPGESRTDRLEHVRGWRIRVLVGVKLEEGPVARLFTGGVASHRANVRS